MFWIDKYRPQSFESNHYVFHQDVKEKLKTFFSCSDHPPLCMYGQGGCGKYTLMRCMLESIYGEEIYNLRPKLLPLQNKQITCMGSNYHFELYGNQYNKLSIDELQDLFETLASGNKTKNMFLSNSVSKDRPIYVVIRNLHKWNPRILSLLLYSSEKYASTLRFLVTCERPLFKLTNFTSLRISMPKHDAIKKWIFSILETEGISNLDEKNEIITSYFERNHMIHLGIILTQFEKYAVTHFRNCKQLSPYHKNIQILLDFIKSKKLQDYVKIRDILYQTLLYSSELDVIKTLVCRLIHSSWVKEKHKIEIVKYASEISHRLTLANIAKTIVHSEAFLLKCITILSKT